MQLIPSAKVQYTGRSSGAALVQLTDTGTIVVLRRTLRGPGGGFIAQPTSSGDYRFPASPLPVTLRVVLTLDFGALVQIHALQPLASWRESGAAFTCPQTPPAPPYSPNLDPLEVTLWGRMGTGTTANYGIPDAARAAVASFQVSHATNEAGPWTVWQGASVPAKNPGSALLNLPPGWELITDDNTRRLRFLRLEWNATAPSWRFNCEFPVGYQNNFYSTISTYDAMRLRLDLQRLDLSYRYRPTLAADRKQITAGESLRVGVLSSNGWQGPYTLRVDNTAVPGAVFVVSSRPGEVAEVVVPPELLPVGSHTITVQESAFSKVYTGAAGSQYPNGADILPDPSLPLTVKVKAPSCCTVWDAALVSSCAVWEKEGCGA